MALQLGKKAKNASGVSSEGERVPGTAQMEKEVKGWLGG